MRPKHSILQPGVKFNRFTVLGFDRERRSPGGSIQYLYKCRCDCGTEKVVIYGNLRAGTTRSCGCLAKENPTNKTHGATGTPEFACWGAIKTRCLNPNQPSWPRYGGRGIKVCERWLESYESFLADMGPRPSKKHSIERRNNDGDYAPDNCYWATVKEQGNNRCTSQKFLFWGEMRTLRQIADASGINYQTFYYRWKNGASLEEASKSENYGQYVFFEGRYMTVREYARLNRVVRYATLYWRIHNKGMKPEDALVGLERHPE